MGNILYIQSTSLGCKIVYTNKQHCVKETIRSEKLKDWIIKLGETYNQPINETSKLMKNKYGYSQKIPIFIKENELLFFSCVSIQSHDCILINYYCVQKYKKEGNETKIYFQDHSILYNQTLQYQKKLPCDFRVIKKQMQRCKRIHDDFSNMLSIEEYINQN